MTSCERHNQRSAVTDRSRSLVYLNYSFHLNPLLDGISIVFSIVISIVFSIVFDIVFSIVFSVVFCIHQGVRYSKYIDLLYFPLWAQTMSHLRTCCPYREIGENCVTISANLYLMLRLCYS
jgi:hypothetical protein